MDSLTIEIIGSIAAFCTTVSFLPQAIKTIQTKDTKALSLPMYITFTIGVFMWLLYGIGVNSYPIIIANSITFLLAGVILGCKVRYK